MKMLSPDIHRRRQRQGLSLIEVVISTMLVGVVLVGAMSCLAGVIQGRIAIGESGRAQQLGEQLLTEIVNHPYQDTGPSPVFGRESGESGGNRFDFDDVDDYDGWSASPPEDRNGNAIFNSEGWQRDVTVEFVEPSDPATISVTDQGLKRITVSVQRSGNVMAELVSFRSDEYIEP